MTNVSFKWQTQNGWNVRKGQTEGALSKVYIKKKTKTRLYALCNFTLDLVCVYALKWRGAPTKNRKCQGHPTACEWNTRGFQPVTILSAESLYVLYTNTHNRGKCWLWGTNDFFWGLNWFAIQGKNIYINTHHSTAIPMCNYSNQGLAFAWKIHIYGGPRQRWPHFQRENNNITKKEAVLWNWWDRLMSGGFKLNAKLNRKT